jgi:hypothetical protein
MTSRIFYLRSLMQWFLTWGCEIYQFVYKVIIKKSTATKCRYFLSSVVFINIRLLKISIIYKQNLFRHKEQTFSDF